MLATLKAGARPSEVLQLQNDSYTAFCLDEAVAFIIAKLREGEKPVISHNPDGKPKIFSRPSQVYAKYS